MEERNTLGKPLTVDDPELFARVWRRVMPDEELSPIALGPAPGPGTEAPDRAADAPPAEGQAGSRQAPIPPPEGEEEPPCLGEGSLPFAPALERRMEQAQQGAQIYQALSRRTQGAAGRQTAALAADQQRHLRRLGAAYFLLTGRLTRLLTPAISITQKRRICHGEYPDVLFSLQRRDAPVLCPRVAAPRGGPGGGADCPRRGRAHRPV